MKTEDEKCALTKKYIEDGIIPRYIYKYVNPDSAKEIIKNNTIKFNSVLNFNDPFDGRADIDINLPPEELSKFPYFDNIGKGLREIAIDTFDKKDYDIILQNISSRTAISCFSQIGDNLLMWAHYAEAHKGMCFKFDISKDYGFFCIPFKVDYKKDLLRYKISEFEHNLTKQYTRKGLAWKYEKEIRIIKPDMSAACIQFNKESLVEITFGCKCFDESEMEIERLLAESGYNNTSLRRARISEKSYKLNFDSIQRGRNRN